VVPMTSCQIATSCHIRTTSSGHWRTQLYSRPRNVSSFSTCGKGYGFLDDSGVMKIDGRRLTQHFVSAGVTNVARVAVDIATVIRLSSLSPCHHGNKCRHRNSATRLSVTLVICAIMAKWSSQFLEWRQSRHTLNCRPACYKGDLVFPKVQVLFPPNFIFWA